jgi:hypothetical protein
MLKTSNLINIQRSHVVIEVQTDAHLNHAFATRASFEPSSQIERALLHGSGPPIDSSRTA